MTKGMSIMEKPLSNNRRHFLPRKLVVASVLGMTFSSLVLFVIFWCTNIFQNTILSTLVVKNGTPMLEWFIRPPIRAVYKIKIFNYTNVDDFESGRTKKLKVEEVGPYIYRETLTRINYVFHENGTISFQEKRSFQWEGGRPDDEIIIAPNVPLMAAMAFVKDMSFFAHLALTGVLTTLQSKPFTSVTAGGLLWGYDDKIFELGKPFISFQEHISFEKFGLLAHKNGVSSDVITMNTGIHDLNQLSMIERVNGRSNQHVWHDAQCDRVYGSEGYMFPYNMIKDPDSTLSIYAVDMRRTLRFQRAGSDISFGVPTYTFKPPTDAFNYNNGEERCFCPQTITGVSSSKTCPPNGIFNSSVCTFNMPIAVSLPHFLNGDESLKKNIDGLNPQQNLHETYVNVHPRLGIVMGGHSRVQLNVEARKVAGIPFLGNIEDGQILPLIWIDVGVDSIPDHLMNLLKHAFFTASTVEAGMKWGSIVGIILSSGALMHVLRKQREAHRAALKRKISGQAKLLEESELGTVQC
ncbi:scavenger receptor class B member 1-like [Chelonus insularis]|uniref:scavenger receptor class B member 1-like n=1 Tax=Chelonus insularis TaxID=460826 RepID=UPI00158ABA0E|nr:scavenger receptor class B member 1-like [Chelonus insularis]